MLTLAFSIQLVKASGTIHIRADGSIDPPVANITTVDNVVYTFTGNIFDSVVVERDDIVVDGVGYTVQGMWSENGIDLSGRSNVTIKNMTITRFSRGVFLNYTNKITIIDNNITANDGSGISLFQSSNNTIGGNNITANKENYGAGISLSYSSFNTISGNNIADNYDGIELYRSSQNIISGNSFVNNGLVVFEAYGSVVSDNLVNSKPLVYLEGASDVVVGDAGQVVLVQCSRIRIENLNLSNATLGVQLWQTNNTEIRGNNITANNRYGIWIRSSSNLNSISGNNIADSWGGILLDDFSNNNSVSGNNIANLHGNGISLFQSSNNTIGGNNIIANNRYGIDLDSSNNNNISGNNIADSWGGVWFGYSSNNRIYHNNFIDNAHRAISFTPGWSSNWWDNGYPSGGNYWSDLNPADGDGNRIGDVPCIIDDDNIDRYPLVYPFNYVPSSDVNDDGIVDIFDVVTVAKAFGCIPGDPDWNPMADINGSTIEDIDEIIDIFDIVTIAKDFGETV